MTCQWCGSSKHSDDCCPTRNLVAFLDGEEVKGSLPDHIGVMSEEEVFNKTEKEWREEIDAIKHVKRTREEQT